MRGPKDPLEQAAANIGALHLHHDQTLLDIITRQIETA